MQGTGKRTSGESPVKYWGVHPMPVLAWAGQVNGMQTKTMSVVSVSSSWALTIAAVAVSLSQVEAWERIITMLVPVAFTIWQWRRAANKDKRKNHKHE